MVKSEKTRRPAPVKHIQTVDAVRLTQPMRDKITQRAIAHKFSACLVLFIEDQAKFADKVYRDLFSAAIRKRMEELPKGWLPEEDDFSVQFGNESYCTLKFSGWKGIQGEVYSTFREVVGDQESVYRRMPLKSRSGCCKVYDARDPLSKEHEKLQQRFSAIVEQLKEAQSTMRVALRSITTMRALLETYPDLKPFCLDMIKSPPARALAVSRDKLAQLLDLPVGGS